MTESRGARRGAALVAALVLAALTSVGLLLPRGVFFVDNDEGYRMLRVRRFVERGPLDLGIDYPAAALDPRGRYRPQRQATTEPLVPLACSVSYRWLGWPGLFLVPALLTAAAAAACHRLALLLGVRRAGVAAAAATLGTPLLFYSLTLWDHAPTASLLTCALVLGLESRRGGSRAAAFGCGALTALAVWAALDAAPAAAALMAAVLIPLRPSGAESEAANPSEAGSGEVRGREAGPRTLWVALGILLVAGLAASYGGLSRGDSAPGALERFATASVLHGVDLTGRELSAAERLGYQGWVAASLLFPRLPEETATTPKALLLMAGILAGVLYLGKGSRNWPLAAAVLALVSSLFCASGVPVLGYQLVTGLLAAAPLLAYGLAGGLQWAPGEGDAAVRRASGYALLAVVLTAVSSPYPATTEWGARFLLPAAPCLAVLAARFLEREGLGARGTPCRGLLLGALAAAVLATAASQTASVWALYTRKAAVAPMARQLADWDVEAIATSIPYQDAFLAGQDPRPRLLLYRGSEELQEMCRSLERRGVRRLGVYCPDSGDLAGLGTVSFVLPVAPGWPRCLAVVSLGSSTSAGGTGAQAEGSLWAMKPETSAGPVGAPAERPSSEAPQPSTGRSMGLKAQADRT